MRGAFVLACLATRLKVKFWLACLSTAPITDLRAYVTAQTLMNRV